MRDRQPAGTCSASRTPPRQTRLKPERRPIGPERAIDGDRAQRRQRHARAAGRPVSGIEICLELEEDIGAIALHERARLVARPDHWRAARTSDAPATFLLRDLAGFDQQSPDRRIGLAIAPIIGKARRAAVGQIDARRTLDLRHENLDMDRAAKEWDARFAGGRARPRSLRVRDRAAARRPSCVARPISAGRRRRRWRPARSDEIVGPREHGRGKFRRWRQGALQPRFVIAGEKARAAGASGRRERAGNAAEKRPRRVAHRRARRSAALAAARSAREARTPGRVGAGRRRACRADRRKTWKAARASSAVEAGEIDKARAVQERRHAAPRPSASGPFRSHSAASWDRASRCRARTSRHRDGRRRLRWSLPSRRRICRAYAR